MRGAQFWPHSRVKLNIFKDLGSSISAFGRWDIERENFCSELKNIMVKSEPFESKNLLFLEGWSNCEREICKNAQPNINPETCIWEILQSPKQRIVWNPTGIGRRYIFDKCGTNPNFTGSELLADPEPFGIVFIYSGQNSPPKYQEKKKVSKDYWKPTSS